MEKNKRKQQSDLKRKVNQVQPGDLICIDWCDASVGKSSNTGTAIDVPVKSWGVFIGVLGEETKHIVLAQNSFRYADGMFDLDYTAIPLSWTLDFAVLAKQHIQKEAASGLVKSFMSGSSRAHGRRGLRTLHRPIVQRRLSIDGKPV